MIYSQIMYHQLYNIIQFNTFFFSRIMTISSAAKHEDPVLILFIVNINNSTKNKSNYLHVGLNSNLSVFKKKLLSYFFYFLFTKQPSKYPWSLREEILQVNLMMMMMMMIVIIVTVIIIRQCIKFAGAYSNNS